MTNCLIVDDDKNTVEIIKTVSADFNEMSFSKVNEDQGKVLNLILKNTPEIVFLNIDSPSINLSEFLFEILQYSPTYPTFIALSSSKEKAYDAYKNEFSNFLLKPLTELSIRKSFLRFQKKTPVKLRDTICLKSFKDYQYLNIDDIIYLKADNNTTDLHMADGRVIVSYKTLKVFENLLSQSFLRIHKSYIINRNCISRIQYSKSICIINNEHKIPFTKTFINNIDKINTSLYSNTMIA